MKSTFRTPAIAVAVAALATGTLFAATSSQASPTPAANPASASALASQLGTHAAGSYVDAAGHQVINVTDAASAAQVRAIGATPKLVTYSSAALAGITSTLNSSARIPGTAWGIDLTTDQVLVSLDQTVTGAKLAKITAVVAKFGNAARIEHVAGTLHTDISGGDAIYGGQYRCSLGFNVRAGSTYYFLTAGHCGNLVSNWYWNSSQTGLLGTTVASSFPGNDYAIVQHTNNGTVEPGNVDLYNFIGQDIKTAADAYVGEAVARSGSTTGWYEGSVTATNVTVNYAEGTVTGLVRTNICAEPGDSGGPLFDGTIALGLASGGTGNCSTGGTTYFQPVTEALSAYGVSVY